MKEKNELRDLNNTYLEKITELEVDNKNLEDLLYLSNSELRRASAEGDAYYLYGQNNNDDEYGASNSADSSIFGVHSFRSLLSLNNSSHVKNYSSDETRSGS